MAKHNLQGLLLSVGILLMLVCINSVYGQPSGSQNLELEKWIVEQTASGTPADLCEFGKIKAAQCIEENYPLISARTIEELLLSGVKGAPRKSIQISHATVEDEIHMDNTSIPVEVNFKYCHFKKVVDFSQSEFAKSVIFDNSHFDGKVSLGLSKIGGNLSFYTAAFNANDPADFSSIIVAGNVVMAASKFSGSVWFQSGQIDGGLDLKFTNFSNPNGTANFQGLAVRGDVLLVGSKNGPTMFDTAVRFDGAKIGGIIQGNNWTFFTNTKEPPRFDDMKTATAEFSIHSFKCRPDFIGMTYDNIQTYEEDPYGEKLAALLDQGQFRTDVYARAEDFLRKNGKADAANRVFFHYKAQERTWLPWYSRWWSGFLMVFIGYGRQPWLAFFWWLGVIAFGVAMFFKKSWMTLSDKKETGHESSRYYNPFWYSLDLFAPVIDLGSAKTWEPGPKHKYPRFARQYSYLHKILGWILIPIALAAITGYLK